MQLSSVKKFFTVIVSVVVFLSPLNSYAGTINRQIPSQNSTVRALGMGDAWTSLARDDSALWYNPAGLARVGGINVRFFSVKAGVSGIEQYQDILTLANGSSGDLASAINGLYGKPVSVIAGGSTAVAIPMFGFGVYNHAEASIAIDNPVYTKITPSIVNDYGFVAGVGIPLGIMQPGLALKYIKRTGIRTALGASTIADLDSKDLMSKVTGWGRGYGLDLGVNFQIPAPFFAATLSTVWRNVGGISFRSDDPNSLVPDEPDDLTVGASLLFDLPLLTISPAIDFRYLLASDIQLARKINFGVEVGIPLIDLRAGFREGYYTAGLGLNLGLFRLDVATYGVELGAYPGQKEDRRYVFEFTMELGIGGFTAGGSSKGGKSKGGSSDSKSIWGGRKLKQRR